MPLLDAIMDMTASVCGALPCLTFPRLLCIVPGEAAVKFEQTPVEVSVARVMKVLRDIHKDRKVPDPVQVGGDKRSPDRRRSPMTHPGASRETNGAGTARDAVDLVTPYRRVIHALPLPSSPRRWPRDGAAIPSAGVPTRPSLSGQHPSITKLSQRL